MNRNGRTLRLRRPNPIRFPTVDALPLLEVNVQRSTAAKESFDLVVYCSRFQPKRKSLPFVAVVKTSGFVSSRRSLRERLWLRGEEEEGVGGEETSLEFAIELEPTDRKGREKEQKE